MCACMHSLYLPYNAANVLRGEEEEDKKLREKERSRSRREKES